MNPKSGSGNASAKMTGNNLRTLLGLESDDTVTIRTISGYFWAALATDKDIILRVRFDDATYEDHDAGTLSTTPTFIEFEITDDAKDLERGASSYALEILSNHNGETDIEYTFVDDLAIDWIQPA